MALHEAPPLDDDVAPVLPTGPIEFTHHEHVSHAYVPFSAIAARPVSKKEVVGSAAARAALLKEWDGLRSAGCWDDRARRAGMG